MVWRTGYIILRYAVWRTPRRAADTPAGGGLADTPAGSGQADTPAGTIVLVMDIHAYAMGGREIRIRREPQGGGREDVSTAGPAGT